MINFRKACIDDLKSVLEIYNDAFSKEDLKLMKHNTQWMENAIHFIKNYL